MADSFPLDKPLPDLLQPDSTQLDAALPDAPLPDKTVQDTAAPDQTAPDQAVPDQTVPDTLKPDSSAPDLAVPDLTIPDQLTPDAGPAVKDPTGIQISKTSANEAQVAVADGNTEFIALWGANGDLFGAKISAQASVNLPFSLSSASGTQSYPAIAFAGKDYLAVFEHIPSGSSRIYARRITSSGQLKDPLPGIPVSDGKVHQVQPAVACSPTQCLVVWQDLRKLNGSVYDIYGRRFDPVKGTTLDTKDVMIGTSKGGYLQIPDVAFDGKDYLVVWMHPRSGSGEDAHGARVSKAGVVLDTTSVAISAGTSSSGYPQVACDGAQGCLVIWNYGSPIKSVRGTITSKGSGGLKVTTPAHFTISNPAIAGWFPDVAFGGNDYLVVWQHGGSTDANIAGARVSKAGKVTSSPLLDISLAVKKQGKPAVARGPNLFMVGWEDFRNGTDNNVYAARVGP